MVLRFKNKDGTGGVLCRPYTWAERMWLKDFATRDHGGAVPHRWPVGPRAGASTNRPTPPAAVGPATASCVCARPAAGNKATPAAVVAGIATLPRTNALQLVDPVWDRRSTAAGSRCPVASLRSAGLNSS